MGALLEPWENLRGFLDTGGYVLWTIFCVSLLLWTLIIERYVYLWVFHPRYLKAVVVKWQARSSVTSWYARKIREATLAEISQRLLRSLHFIKTLIALCPLLGLLGTVTGMIHVFDTMAVIGTGNARAMATGVSMATVPTMAGMVVAISGLFFSARLQQQVALESQRAADLLRDYGDERP